MRILNIAVNGVYTDGYSYHENMLPRYHHLNGHEVWTLTSEYVFNAEGGIEKTKGDRDYTDTWGVHILRLPIRGDRELSFRLKRFEGFYEAIERIAPDLIFCHLFQFLDVLQLIRYKKHHPEVPIFFDSHADYSNSAQGWLSKHLLHGLLWRWCAHRVLPIAETFYGVLPARVDFLTERYRLPADKVQLLVMGADDVMTEQAIASDARSRIRSRCGISEDDFLVVTGGKIDLWKQQTLLLMDAVNHLEGLPIRLLVFGPVVPELKEQLLARCSARVQYLGWQSAEDSYALFAAADLAAFPGRHSVFWEQAAGQGIPLLVKDWPGTHHVDVGGNVRFLREDSEEEIKRELSRLLTHPEEYAAMRAAARTKGMQVFSYREIAKRSIELHPAK